MARKLFFLIIMLNSLHVLAQDHQDALRLSQSLNSGTARFVSMGGAFGALGADFSSLSFNPAGLGVYRTSEFTVTTSIKNKEVNSVYLNQPAKDYRTRVLFDNLGFVASFKTLKEEEKGLVHVNIGMGYNRLHDFFEESYANGANSSGSMMNYFATAAGGTNYFNLTDNENNNPYGGLFPWDAVMAWNTFLIDTVPGSANSYTRAINDGEGVYQDQSLSSSGGVGEYAFSLAANFSNKLFIGGTLGVQDIYYRQQQYYSEEAVGDNSPLPNGDRFESFDYTQTLVVEGSGVNFKIGAIYKPIQILRLGIALHSPTFFSINETYRASMKSFFNNFDSKASTPLNLYDYRIKTPARAIASIALTFGELGLISFDYEYLDYGTSQFIKGGDGYRFTDENNAISRIYTKTYNIKAGGEVWLKKLALRAGYAQYGSPFASHISFGNSDIKVLSAGFGLRIEQFFIDWAYQRYFYNDSFTMYIDSPVITRDLSQNKFFLTLGYRF